MGVREGGGDKNLKSVQEESNYKMLSIGMGKFNFKCTVDYNKYRAQELQYRSILLIFVRYFKHALKKNVHVTNFKLINK